MTPLLAAGFQLAEISRCSTSNAAPRPTSGNLFLLVFTLCVFSALFALLMLLSRFLSQKKQRSDAFTRANRAKYLKELFCAFSEFHECLFRA